MHFELLFGAFCAAVGGGMRVNMNNISCSVVDCNEPVIGQCQGYHEPCGRFYCKRHSVGKLCDECFAETEKDRIYAEYVR